MATRFRRPGLDDKVFTVRLAKRVLPVLVQDEVKRQIAILNLRPPFWVRFGHWLQGIGKHG